MKASGKVTPAQNEALDHAEMIELHELTRVHRKPGKLDLSHLAPKQELFRREEERGRNDSCPCGSGKKYMKCGLRR